MMDEICLELSSFNEKTNQKRRLTLPLHALLWLRNQMAEMLAKHDGTEEIEKEAPAQIPQKFLHMGVSHASPVPNDTSSVQKLKQQGNRSQLGENKPKSFPKMTTKMQNSNQIGYGRQKMFTSLPIQQKPMKQSETKKPIKYGNEKLNQEMAEFEGSIRALFDFDEEQMEKYRRIIAKRKFPARH